MATRSRWTDERLDDAFAGLRADIRELRRELDEARLWLMRMFATQVLGFIALVVEIGVKG